MQQDLDAYRKFVDERLRPDLAHITQKLATVDVSIADYERMEMRATELASSRNNNDSGQPILIPINLGCGYEADFEVYDKDYVLVAVGFGFYCQMTWSEAAAFCPKRRQILQRQRRLLCDKQNRINEHLDEIEGMLSKLASTR